jgi:hypothetical protein
MTMSDLVAAGGETTAGAVTAGIASSAGVVSSAALIMIAVFSIFIGMGLKLVRLHPRHYR